MHVPLFLEHFMNFGVLGKINGKGYYTYEKGSKPKPDPSVLPIIEESRQCTKIMPSGKVRLPSESFYRLKFLSTDCQL